MVSKAKLYSRLDLLEIELKEGLVPHLREAALGENEFVFCVSPFNSSRELKSRIDRKTEKYVVIGAQILSLRAKLDEPTSGTIAERICWYCREWINVKNHNKNSAAGLAKLFLDEIEYDSVQ